VEADAPAAHATTRPRTARDITGTQPLTASPSDLGTIEADVPDFVSRNALHEVSELSPDVVDAVVFAEQHGWTDSRTGNTRYVREKGQSEGIEVIIHKQGEECTVYLSD
jgi:hypothetical protein